MKKTKFRFIQSIYILFFLLAFFLSPSTQADSFLHTRGQDIVDEEGNTVLLRGVGLGNWLLPEGYMWKFGKEGDRPRKIEALVEAMIGPEAAEQFWLDFRRHYITEADIQRIAELGFNSVRPALNARRFLTEGDDPTMVPEGFELLDDLVRWCAKYNLYVIIDMHGAPGGQTGANIDDSPNDLPELFTSPDYQKRLIDLWVKIADRYKNEPAVAAYDLLNEPLPARTGAAEKYKDQLEPLYKRITAAIRAVDKKHMITLEGCDWSNDWSVFTEPFDDNVFYQFHYYCWDPVETLKGIDTFLTRREQFNTPVWVGETGEKGKTIYWGTTQYFEANNIGWSFWPWKKMDTVNTPYSINRPIGWDAVAAFSRGKDKPSADVAQKALNELLDNIKLQNCVYYPDVVNAILRRVPGKVETENYGHEGKGKSYSVSDASHKSEYYRKSEPVPVIAADEKGAQKSIRLQPGEWTAYAVNSVKTQNYKGTIRVKAETAPASLTFSVGKQKKNIDRANTDWKELDLGIVTLSEGENRLQIDVDGGSILCDWFLFEDNEKP
jgi:hypothetical protein